MPITFTTGLTPTFPPNSFGSEKTHVKQLGVDLIAGTAFKNPLWGDDLNYGIDLMLSFAMGARILIDTDRTNAGQASGTMNGYVSGTLPAGFAAAGYVDADMTNIANASIAYMADNSALQTQINTFRDYFLTVDVDNFKLHNELLCGLDDAPPRDIEKPNLVALMGLARSITDLENNHGIAFTNYLTGLFGSLFTADTTIENAREFFSNTDGGTWAYAFPVGNQNHNASTTHASLNILAAVGANPFVTTPAALISSINALSGPMSTYGTAMINTHLAAFTAHITTDMAYYNMLIAKGKAYVQAYQVSGHIQDPYYRFMYTDVFGHDDIQQTITDLANGTIE